MTYKDPDKQREADRERQRRRRDKIKAEGVTEQGVTEVIQDIGVRDEVLKAEGITKTCKYCFKQLEFAVLECCNDCAEMRSKPVSPARDGHILASRPALEFTGKLTASESEHYKPANKLKPGQYNPVSKPGDSHYGQA